MAIKDRTSAAPHIMGERADEASIRRDCTNGSFHDLNKKVAGDRQPSYTVHWDPRFCHACEEIVIE
ncbi:hypothetical protein [Tropicimonas aquimaris]|uniref:Uncharacterized protein n=1 Tax=Tropicimonas aquimaris TaxID=914152 RepID=A0ABW3IKZ9_9RHOB